MNNSIFDMAFNKTMAHEGKGKLTNDKFDPGGMTFSGISRVYWPEWEGWKALDCGDMESAAKLVNYFYRVNFWNRIQGDKLADISPAIAYEVFDTAVNVGVSTAVRFLQTGHNIAGGLRLKLITDGQLGPKTIETLKKYMASQPGTRALNEEILLNCCNGEQYIFYKSNPNHKRYRGWFRRV